MISTKRISGLVAKRQGQSFENIFETSCQYHGLAVTRIPDGCRQVHGGKLIRVKSPYDFTISYRGRSAMIDTKTQAGKTFPYARIDIDQARNLSQHERQGVTAGYVVWLRDIDSVVFIAAVTDGSTVLS